MCNYSPFSTAPLRRCLNQELRGRWHATREAAAGHLAAASLAVATKRVWKAARRARRSVALAERSHGRVRAACFGDMRGIHTGRSVAANHAAGPLEAPKPGLGVQREHHAEKLCVAGTLHSIDDSSCSDGHSTWRCRRPQRRYAVGRRIGSQCSSSSEFSSSIATEASGSGPSSADGIARMPARS